MKHIYAPLAAASLLTLTACGGGGDKPEAAIYCPSVAVLDQAKQVTDFLPGRSDIGAEITTAQITGVAGSCSLTKKDGLHVTFKTGFSASNGPANNGQDITLPYIVAIAKGDQIVSSADYAIKLSFNGNLSTTSATSKPITIAFPNDPSNTSYQVLVAFHLSPAQQAYNAIH